MTTFEDVYRHLVEPPPVESGATRGLSFERLILQLLRTAPAFRDRFTNVWIWGDTTSLGDDSTHADMVAERHDGRLVAVECKTALTQRVLDSFVRDTQDQAGDRSYVERLLFTATPWRPRPVLEPPLEILDPQALDALDPPIDWDSLLTDEELSGSPLAGVRPPRAAVEQARQHVLDALTGIRDVTRGMEARLDRYELGEDEVFELRLLRELAIPTLEDLNARLDTLGHERDQLRKETAGAHRCCSSEPFRCEPLNPCDGGPRARRSALMRSRR